MNLRSKLFKKPWQTGEPEARAAAVLDAQDPELKDELPRLAQHDEAAPVRLAALKRLNSEPFWLDARLRESDKEIIAAADLYLSRELFRTERSDLQSARLEWLALISDAELLRRCAAEAPALALRRAAIARITAQGFLGDCYIRESNEGLAGEILERIDQPSTLERVAQAAKRSSKRRAQAAAERLEQLQVESGHAIPGKTASERLVRDAEALARGALSGDRASARTSLQERWDAIPDHPENLTRRFEGAMRIVDGSLNRASREPEPAVTSAPALDPEPGLAPVDAQLAASADYIRCAIRSGTDIKPADLLAHWDRAWNQLESVTDSDLGLKQELLPLLHELQALVLMQAEQPGQAPQPTTEPPRADPRIDFGPQLDAIAATLEAGDIAKAHEQIHSVRRDYDKLPAKRRPHADGGRLQRMEGRLKEMRDWQRWSNNQAREELIASVEQLATSGQHPDAITAALKKARGEWQHLEALEVLPGDKRRFAAPPGHWRKFQAACKAAFESAKPYFEKREQIQRDNLETLKAFVAAGRAAAADDTADSTTVLGFLRKARQAIRRMDDLPPKTRGASAASLRELMNQLSARLDQRFDAIEAVKRRLVAQARALSHEKDVKAAADKAKDLQNQWQKAGVGRRKIEQELWQAFREPIDPLFAQLKGEQDQRRQADREVTAELQALCEQIEALAKLPEEELDGARGRLTKLVDEWLQQDGRGGRLNKRFEQAERRFEQRLAGHRINLRERSRGEVLALAESIQSLWQQRCEGLEGDLADKIARGQDSGPTMERLRGLAERIAAPDFNQPALEALAAANAESARQICVEMEFLSGLDTAPADQALRMDYQVQRLARRMSEREHQPDLATELTELQRRWYDSLPHPPEQHDALQQRFERARDVIEGMTGQ